MKTYVGTTFYFERGAWTFDYMHVLFNNLVTHLKWSNYEIGINAYELTMAKYHTWVLQYTVKLCLHAIKNKDDMVQMYMEEQEAVSGNKYTVEKAYSEIGKFGDASNDMSKYIWSFLKSYGIEHLP